MEIVPNPFGGVNTHLWRIEAYIVGIVPHSMAFYTVARERHDVQRILRLSGVVSGKHKMRKMFFSPNL
jgi:hypothetical protein